MNRTPHTAQKTAQKTAPPLEFITRDTASGNLKVTNYASIHKRPLFTKKGLDAEVKQLLQRLEKGK